MELKVPSSPLARYLAKIDTSVKVAIRRTNQNQPPRKSFNPIVKVIELVRLTSSAVFFSLAEQNMLEEKGEKNAHDQTISDQRRDDVREKLKELFGHN